MVGFLSWHHIELFKHRVLASSLSVNTINTYSSGIRQYLRFCERFRCSPLPLVEAVLENFCVNLFHTVGHKGIKVYLCGVQLWSRMNCYSECIASMDRLRYVLRGIRKLQGNTHIRPPRQPVTLQMLEFMFSAADLFASSHDRDMIRAATTVAFFGLLRVSEICPPSSSKFLASKHLTVGDVSIDVPGRFASISLKESKSDPFRLGVVVRIGALSHRLCPVRALASFLVTRGSGTGPLFIFESGAALTRGFLVNMLRQWFPTASSVNTHSFRRGGETALAARMVCLPL